MSSGFQNIRWLPMEDSIDPKSSGDSTHSSTAASPPKRNTSIVTFAETNILPVAAYARKASVAFAQTNIFPAAAYARKASIVYARKASVAFARRVSGALALFLVYWRGHNSNGDEYDTSDTLVLKDTLRATIKEHNTLNTQIALTRRRGTYGQVGMPQDGAIEVYMPPYDKELLHKIEHLPDVAFVERPLPSHLPSMFAE